ncbi:MAG TPA: amino acid--tRNA ligase-related protein [Mycobacteriales bacterium]|nr:amino acid--tRNA ligase-related protein [Mycobacteriales bacterium]
MAAAGTVPPGARPALEKTYVRDLPKRLGQRVALYGWFNGMHRAGGGLVLVIRDRTGTVPAVYRGTAAAAGVDGLSPESAVRVVGTVRTGAGARFGAIEVDAESIDVLALAESPLPRDGQYESSAPIERRHLDLRGREQFLVFAVQTTLEAAVRDFLLGSDFVEIHTPKVTPAGCGPGDPLVGVSFDGQSAALSPSPQAYLQLAMAAGFDRVFEVGPAFPAGDAGQPPAESTRLDLEVSWIDSPAELMSLLEDLLRRALFAVREVHGVDIEGCFGIPVELPEGTIPRLPLARALELVGRASRPHGRLSAGDEQALCRYADERYGHGYIFLTGYATEWPFSAMRDEPGGLRGFVLLGHGLELAAGAQREHRYGPLRAQAAAATPGEGSPPDWYYEMFRHGCPPHGGLGIGLNRLLMGLLARPSIRDTTFASCGPGRSQP